MIVKSLDFLDTEKLLFKWSIFQDKIVQEEYYSKTVKCHYCIKYFGVGGNIWDTDTREERGSRGKVHK